MLLVGSLGAGKTCFVQGLAIGLGVEEYVHSPTFVLVAQYRGRRGLAHVDLYRVESAEEAMDLGLDEHFNPDEVTVVEWADKAMEAWPADHLLVELDDLGGDRRGLTLRASGPASQRLLDATERQTADR